MVQAGLSTQADAPRVITVPPVMYVAALAIGIALEYLVPTAVVPDDVQYPAGFALIAVSASIMPFVLLQFRKAGTSFDTRKPTSTIIKGGPYRFSRNPAYLALTLLYAGIGIAADSIWILGLLVPTLVLMHYGVISCEERYLENKFGEEYLRYRRSVRRWL